ncbi:hypothetical protein ZYGR_0AD03190 [Zygosaccharomyces rouxii]|uniref:ZYRO0G13398p n=2 Tax=Zygosaccharomyces rouxii TaxID=4956 RepID=C5E0K1_ZYGRC|nr:uncharacterized protein ZYRO0G13398g [Zygosaccharomyces rouxii]KAH9202629.1 hypothetical protein LQ764DRAFT_36081 [Zygosaccharomyces rouxii]GAV51136.1 hypothetical protein ZYGR_0AD03190 [Zygosaccharomyces rouxii]CAR29635.1 ZYRO0G13398p [Zygosaccharomyces rouxii]
MLRRFSVIYSAARILRTLELQSSLFVPYSRGFSCLRPTDSQQSKDDIANWMKSSLNDPIPTHQVSSAVETQDSTSSKHLSHHPFVFIVSQEDYRRDWFYRFNSGDLRVVENVLTLANEKSTVFTLAQIETLLRRLKYLRRNFEAHEIFCAYQGYLRHLRKNDMDQEAYCNFLEIVLRVEDSLGNYEICEELFSEYIKFPNLNAKIITIGFRSFIENNNLQLAKEFYIQALNNPDTFPLSEKELILFLNDLDVHGDYKSVQAFFNLWLKKKSNDASGYLPSRELLCVVHGMYRKNRNEELLVDFLSHEAVQKAGYPSDIFFELNEFYYNLHCRDIWSQSKLESKINYFIVELRYWKEKREEFYLFLLNFFVLSKDFGNIKFVLSLIQKDHIIRLKPKFHLAIARYFVNEGMLQDLMGYYSDVLKRRGADSVHLRISIIAQLYRCALFAHPTLSKEIANEFTVLLNRDEYVRQFPRLREFLKRLSRIRPKGRKTVAQYTGVLELSPVDYERLEIFENRVNHGDLVGAKSFILENLRRGIQPSFNLHYCILQKILKLQLPTLAKTLDELFLSVYQRNPMKLKILWLRYGIMNEYNAFQTSSESISLAKYKVLSSKLLDFERHHQSVLDFVNYMQLTQICLQIREYELAVGLLQRGATLINEKDKRHWQIYYMTALKLSARVYDMEAFSKLLQEWNENSSASWIAHSSLRQIKSYIKLFAKRSNRIPNYDENTMQEIVDACESLVHKYANLKFEGLDAMHDLMNFLKGWLDIEMQSQQKLLSDRQAILLTKFSKEQSTIDNSIK